MMATELYRLNKLKGTGMLDLGAILNILTWMLVSQEAAKTVILVRVASRTNIMYLLKPVVHAPVISPQIPRFVCSNITILGA